MNLVRVPSVLGDTFFLSKALLRMNENIFFFGEGRVPIEFYISSPVHCSQKRKYIFFGGVE